MEKENKELMSFLEEDAKGTHIKTNFTPAVRAAAEKFVDAAEDLRIVLTNSYGVEDQMISKWSYDNTLAHLRGTARKESPALPHTALYRDKNGKRHPAGKATHRLRGDMSLALNENLNLLLKEIAESKGVEAPILTASRKEEQKR